MSDALVISQLHGIEKRLLGVLELVAQTVSMLSSDVVASDAKDPIQQKIDLLYRLVYVYSSYTGNTTGTGRDVGQFEFKGDAADS
jgi:hypothetical protein